MLPPSSPTPSLEVRHHRERTVLSFCGCDTLNEYNSQTISRHLAALPEVAPGAALLVDLAGIRYVTSTALGTLVALNHRVRSAGGRLALANVAPFVRESLAITRLDEILEILPPEHLAPPSTPPLSEPIRLPV